VDAPATRLAHEDDVTARTASSRFTPPFRSTPFAAWLVAATLAAAGCAKGRPAVPAPPDRPPLSPIERLSLDIMAATRLPGVQRGVWGIAVHSLDRDERIFALNPDTLLVPASTTKLVSLSSAVDAVGWDHRFLTTLAMSGGIVNILEPERTELGVLRGDLLITGGGDPSIAGRGGDDLSGWIDALKARGIRRIEGRIIGDDNAIEEPRPALAWAWDDLGYTTGALFGALNLAENRLTVTITPSAVPGAPAQIGVEPFAASRIMSNRVLTAEPGSRLLVWPEQRPGEPVLTIAGSIPAAAAPVTLSVAAGNPTLWFASVLRNRLIEAGIYVHGDAVDIDDLLVPPDRSLFTIVHAHWSRPLSEIAQPLLKDSINLYGEAVLRLNAPPEAFPTNDAALEGLRLRLAAWGIPEEAQQIVDGSGLSRRNVITPAALATVLRRMHDPEATSPWMIALPVAGVDGSLRTRMTGTPAEGNVRAKTGTMSNVRSLAGYATTQDGERLAFAIILNNFEGASTAATQAVDAIAVSLATFTRTPPITIP
jgi:D-alanyl-D-alanine carboxypeptidase/D-alanyl-D-alanine-endopeptidase (penicillin-binding protein 4)